MDFEKERTPLEVVIQYKELMKTLWDNLSVLQQVIVKALYGLELTTRAERRAWAILNDFCKNDALGFVTEWWECPYEKKEYTELVALIGRRSGKSYLTCFIAVYEIIFGGHAQFVEPGAEFVIPYIAQDLPTARVNMRMISLLCKKIPNLAAQIVDDKANYIKFKNGLTVQIEPPRVKTGRGWAMPLIIMDEVGFWPTDDEAADQDIEVLRAISPATLQFPHKKILIISSPNIESGILWDYYKAGTQGKHLALDDVERTQYQDSLVLHASTAAMENPRLVKIMKNELLKEQSRDPEGFVREFLAKFIKSVSAFILSDDVISCTEKGKKERQPTDALKLMEQPAYIAVMDPAFRVDSFAFSIFHNNKDGVVIQDVLKVWTPDKKLKIPLDPMDVLTDIGRELKRWGISIVYSDQYQLEALQQIAQTLGFAVIKHDFSNISKSKMYGSLHNLLRTKKIILLDHVSIYEQLTRLIKKRTTLGTIQIMAPPGEHDDVATVCAMGAELAVQLRPRMIVEQRREPTLFEQGLDCIRRKTIAARREQWD